MRPPNAPRAAFDAASRCLQDILEGVPGRHKGQPFGGMPILLGGDFRQVPPVLRRIDIEQFAEHTLKACDWWVSGTHLSRYSLRRNKRAEADPDYADMVLQIGDGSYGQETPAAHQGGEADAMTAPQAGCPCQAHS